VKATVAWPSSSWTGTSAVSPIVLGLPVEYQGRVEDLDRWAAAEGSAAPRETAQSGE
jgi:hypothetical protein